MAKYKIMAKDEFREQILNDQELRNFRYINKCKEVGKWLSLITVKKEVKD